MDNIVNVHGCRFEIRNPKDHIQKHWIAGSFYEANKSGLLAYLTANRYTGRCLDIGASIGNHTVYLAKKLGCDVIAFEPSRESFEHLVRNCELNDVKAALLNFALGYQTGMCSMEDFGVDNVGMKQVSDGNDTFIDRLDNLVGGQFSFIKIDVEGYNEQLLKGAERVLKEQNKCHVFIECDTPKVLSQTSRIMSKYGYIRHDVKLNHTPTYLWTK